MAETAQPPSQRNLTSVHASEINSAWLVKDFVWLQILSRWDVSHIKGTVIADISVFFPHHGLIAVDSILLVKFVNGTLFDRYARFFPIGVYRISPYIEVNLGP